MLANSPQLPDKEGQSVQKQTSQQPKPASQPNAHLAALAAEKRRSMPVDHIEVSLSVEEKELKFQKSGESYYGYMRVLAKSSNIPMFKIIEAERDKWDSALTKSENNPEMQAKFEEQKQFLAEAITKIQEEEKQKKAAQNDSQRRSRTFAASPIPSSAPAPASARSQVPKSDKPLSRVQQMAQKAELSEEPKDAKQQETPKPTPGRVNRNSLSALEVALAKKPPEFAAKPIEESASQQAQPVPETPKSESTEKTEAKDEKSRAEQQPLAKASENSIEKNGGTTGESNLLVGPYRARTPGRRPPSRQYVQSKMPVPNAPPASTKNQATIAEEQGDKQLTTGDEALPKKPDAQQAASAASPQPAKQRVETEQSSEVTTNAEVVVNTSAPKPVTIAPPQSASQQQIETSPPSELATQVEKAVSASVAPQPIVMSTGLQEKPGTPKSDALGQFGSFPAVPKENATNNNPGQIQQSMPFSDDADSDSGCCGCFGDSPERSPLLNK